MGRPLAVRWGAHELPELHAGVLSSVRVELENAGDTPWRGDRFTVSYHWLDELGNAIVWDGLRTPVAAEPGSSATVDVAVRAPIPPGHYRLSIDLVDESRFWFGELGEQTLDFEVDVLEREGDAGRAPRRGDRRPRLERARARRAPRGLRDRRRLGGRPSSPGRARGVCPAGARARLRAPTRVPFGARGCGGALDGGGGTPRGRPARRRAGALRRADHSSTAIRSSTRLNAHAPSASAAAAATQR